MDSMLHTSSHTMCSFVITFHVIIFAMLGKIELVIPLLG
jgi:hypothetical protein